MLPTAHTSEASIDRHGGRALRTGNTASLGQARFEPLLPFYHARRSAADITPLEENQCP